jgi:hypothetical protein
MILEDFTMLGTTVPEPKADGRVFVCSAGVSRELGLVRIYPLARRGIPRRWRTYRVPLEKNNKDPRKESWKVQGDRSAEHHNDINAAFKEIGEVKLAERAELLKKFIVPSIAEANRQKLSLAIINPTFGPMEFKHNENSPDSPQLKLFDPNPDTQPELGAKRFPFNPYLNFTDEEGDHRLQIREWGCYEFMRKYPGRHTELDAALRLNADCSLFVGNLNARRNTWLIISVLRGIRTAQPTLFDIEAAS